MSRLVLIITVAWAAIAAGYTSAQPSNQTVYAYKACPVLTDESSYRSVWSSFLPVE